MNRFLLAALLLGCGSKTQPPIAPLPPDNPVAVVDAGVDAEAAEVPVRPVPTGPLQVKLAPPSSTVKLVKPGTGKRTVLALAPKVGAKQQVELALDFGVTQSAGGQSQKDIVPTVLLGGEAETTATGKEGLAYKLTVAKTDARAIEGAQVPIDKFKEILVGVQGLVISGSVGGEVSLDLAQQREASGQVLDLIRLTYPAFPAFPTEPLGAGAKWQTTTKTKLADRLDVTIVTDYELVSYKAGTWTIKGASKLTGADQIMQGGKISKIAGTGTHEVSVVDGALFPSHRVALTATFTAAEAEPKPNAPPATLDFEIKVGAAVTAK
jgi:hypothetical protein